MDGRASCKPEQQSCWRRRTHLEKVLLVLIGVASLILIAVVIAAATHAAGKSASTEVCLTEECVKSAARILDAIDPTVDPCNDFFEFACGKWNREHPIPDELSKYDVFTMLGDKLQDTLRSLLETKIEDSDIPVIRMTKHIYQSCLNTTAIEVNEDSVLSDIISSVGGWPVINSSWDESQFDLTVLMTRIRRLVTSTPFFIMYVGVDEKNSLSNLIQIDQPNQFPMESRDYYLKGKDDKILTIYKTFAKNVVKTLGATEQQADEQFNDVINFEIELANITMPLDQRRANREAQYNRVKVKELSTNFTSAIDWVRFIQTVFADVNISIEADHDLNIRAPDYVRKLGELIEKTSKRTLQNYGVWWCLTTTLYELLSQKFQVLRKDFNKALKGTNQEMARWRYCVNFINQNLGVSVGRLYVERYFRSESKDNALDMVYKVHRAFIDILQEVTWLGEQTKKVAQAKADAIREKIGYPDFILNDTALEKEYAGVRGTPDNFFVNVISISRAALLENLRQLHLPIDRDRWSTPPVTVNAYYHPSKNIIMFPAGILQPPFYHKDNPMYLNFGGIATIIGHEITHGFDDQGRLFDIDGNVNLWWSEDDVRNFLQKAECFVEQYGNYTVKEVRQNINGRQTLGENIADNGGIKQSYRAYTQWVNENGQEPLLPGINLNQDQLFFLNFAQSWCGSTRPELLVRWIRSFQHSPRRERVMGTLSNSVEFAAAYRCPPGSPMNPVKKCRIW